VAQLPSGTARSGSQQEGVGRLDEGIGQVAGDPVLLVLVGQPCLVVGDGADRRNSCVCFDSCGDIGVQSEDPDDTGVIGRWPEADNEAAREQVLAKAVRLLVLVNEDVGERRGSIREVCGFLERTKKPPDPAVDLGRVIIVDGLDVLVRWARLSLDSPVNKVVSGVSNMKGAL
jgi:hypothetical protein